MNLRDGFELLGTAPDGVARLRELILSLAVQGKLVRQDLSDEPASALLLRIAKNKDRLISEGRVKRDRSLPDIVEAETPFQLPVGWQWVRLGMVGQIVGGGTPKSDVAEYWDDGDVPWLTPADLYGFNDKRISGGRRNISRQGLANSSAQQLPAGTVLFSSRAPIGYVAIADTPLATNQGFKSCAPYVDGMSDFLYWFLKSAAKAIDAAASGTTFKEISGGEFSKILVPLPPLAEQARIVAKVDELMRLCDELEARGHLEAEQHARLTATLLEALAASESAHALAENWSRVAANFDLLLDRPEAIDALEQTIMQLAVRGRLVTQDPIDEPAKELLHRIRAEKDRLIVEGKIKRDKPLPEITDEAPFELPDSWEWTRLAHLGERFDYGTSQKTGDGPGVPVLRMGNIQRGQIVFDSLKFLQDQLGDLPSLYLRKSDLLFNRTNSYELVGKTGLFLGESEKFSFASYLIRVRLMSPLVCPEYVNIYINSIDCRQTQIEPQIVQQNGQANFNGTKLQQICVPLPPLAEQERIVARVQDLRRLCADLRARLTQRQSCQAHLAAALVEQTAAAGQDAGGLALAA